ncbi:translocation/assembly module TamB domain-containing protein [Agriterribacter humi]|uniref:translocation/assembly module TamB domain-containing protein n=1 Tax=Agriterribacter humi TaxID=1104781 RepID=UPI0012650E58|nr:translocation/assembly module TamB domain-containing protein [Agriterribacter humi]
MSSMDQQGTKKNTGRRIARIVVKTVLFILLFLVLLAGLILTPPVQNFIRGKAVTYLEKKLHTKVAIGKIYIGFPKKVVVENVYIEDRSKDTLISGGSIKVNVDLFDLITGNGVDIQSVELDNITAKIKRQLPDTVFNFQFIVDAFASTDTSPKEEDTSSTPITLRSVELNKIRTIYKDAITGNDVEAYLEHFDTRLQTFDLEKMQFSVAPITLQGLTARVYQSKPLLDAEPAQKDITDAKTPLNVQLDIDNLDLQNINLDYRNDVSALYTQLNLGALQIQPKKIDLAQRIINLDALALDSTTVVLRLGKKEGAEIVKKETRQEAEAQAEAGWRVQIGNLQLDNNNLQLDDDNSPKQQSGMDYMHLKTEALTLHVSDLLYSSDSIAGNITKGTFSEQSGFVLNQLQTHFLYSNRQAYLKELYLKTPGTELKRSIAIRYDCVAALQKDIGRMELNLDLQKSKIQVKDILTFVPDLHSQPAFADPNTTWLINGRISGRIADLQLPVLQISGLKDTRIDISGRLRGLPDMNNLGADLSIKNISSSQRDIALFVPAGTLPQNITLPSQMHVSGKLNGNTGKLVTDLLLKTSLGNASLKGTMEEIADAKRSVYNLQLNTTALDLGTILQNKESLGPVSADFHIKGNGYDIKTANATLTGKIRSAIIKQYEYRDLNMKGTIADQQATVHADIADPNIHFAADATADLSKEYPSVQLNATIDSIKTQALHLTGDELIYRGNVKGDFKNTNPDSLDGTLFILQSLLVHNQQRVQMDTIQLLAGTNDSARYIQLNSDVVNARLLGRYKLTELGSIFQYAIPPYFAMADTDSAKKPEPYDFTINANIINGPALKAFVPQLERMDSVVLKSRFTTNEGWNALLAAPVVHIGANQVDNLQLNASTADSALQINADVENIVIGKSLALHKTNITASVANNTIDYALNIKDKTDSERYNLKGLLQQSKNGDYLFSIKPEDLLLNYKDWTISADNRITVADEGVHAENFVLNQDKQQLSINSISEAANAPMEIGFSNFSIATLTGFVQPDSTLADGTLNGTITISNLMQQPVFVGDLSINELSIKKDTVGNVKMLVNNKVADTYNADVTITGNDNDVQLSGNYYANNKAIDLSLDIRKLPLTTAQAFSAGALRDASGFVNGAFKITGTTDQPAVNGELLFNKTVFNLSMLNNMFAIDQEKLSVTSQGIVFDRFEIRDSASNALMLDGTAATSNFLNYNFDLKIRADNFRALNSTKKDNKLFYGQLYFNTNLTVKGTEKAPVIDGSLKVNEKTKMTIVLPQNEPGVADREGIVVFIDKDAPKNDSLFLASYDSLNTSSLQGMDVSVNIEVDKAADFTLIVDEGNGDFLNVRGDAQLSAGVDPSGKITLAGTYEMEEGSYDLTFNFLHRKFDIVKGSKITWEGEPTDANVDITAKYTASTAPLDLVKNQLGEDVTPAQRNTYLQKLPFDVMLSMTGKLLKPDISFNIILPENKNYGVSNDILANVRTKLDILRQEEAEMNKQVFSLLLLNRFVAEDPFRSSGSTSASTLVRQSVSKLMTEQLNQLAADLVKGVDLNFDIAASDDYTTGERQSRTDLNVGLSKKLLNDRLTVTVGSNFEVEGPKNSNQASSNIAGDVALDYRLSEDGRYMLRAYRKNDYQGVIDGYIVETGIGFIITVDYNRFRDIFRKRKTPEQRRKDREIKKTERQEQKNNPPENTNPANQ